MMTPFPPKTFTRRPGGGRSSMDGMQMRRE
jgi:hypothetical protein